MEIRRTKKSWDGKGTHLDVDREILGWERGASRCVSDVDTNDAFDARPVRFGVIVGSCLVAFM